MDTKASSGLAHLRMVPKLVTRDKLMEVTIQPHREAEGLGEESVCLLHCLRSEFRQETGPSVSSSMGQEWRHLCYKVVGI